MFTCWDRACLAGLAACEKIEVPELDWMVGALVVSEAIRDWISVYFLSIYVSRYLMRSEALFMSIIILNYKLRK